MGASADARWDRRRCAALVVLLVAGLAVVATTPAQSSVEAEDRGTTLLLGPDHTEVTAAFTFEATDAALDDFDSLGLDVEHEAFWTDVADPPDVAVEVVKTDGPELEPWQLDDGRCGADAACVGTYEVTFRWPDGLESGSVRIEWHVAAQVDFNRSDAPRGAELHIDVERVDDAGAAPHRFFEQDVVLDAETPATAQQVTVSTRAALPPAVELAVELDPRLDPEAHVVLTQDGAPVAMVAGGVTLLRTPDRCHEAPCRFHFVVASLLGGRGTARFTWGLTRNQIRRDLDVHVQRLPVPTLAASAELGQVHLVDDDELEVLVTVDLPRAMLATQEFDLAPPVLHVTVDPRVVAGEVVVPEGGQLRVEVESTRVEDRPHERLGGNSWHERTIRDAEPLPVVVPNHCGDGVPAAQDGGGQDAPIACSLDFLVRLATRGWPNGFQGGRVELHPTIEVAVPHPMTRDIPDDAELVIRADPS